MRRHHLQCINSILGIESAEAGLWSRLGQTTQKIHEVIQETRYTRCFIRRSTCLCAAGAELFIVYSLQWSPRNSALSSTDQLQEASLGGTYLHNDVKKRNIIQHQYIDTKTRMARTPKTCFALSVSEFQLLLQSLTYFDLIFVQSKWQWSKFNLLHVDIQFP